MLKSMLVNILPYEDNFTKPNVDVLKDKVLERVLIAPKTKKTRIPAW